MRNSLLIFLFFLASLQVFGQDTPLDFITDKSPCAFGVQREVRAVWLTTLSGLDWPKARSKSHESMEQQKRELRQILDKLQACGINTVIFQTRIRGTVVYPSALEPFDPCLTGKAGENPGYDPLKFAIDECHRRNMELHAWVVAFPICKNTVVKELGSRTLPRRRPDLCQPSNEQWLMDPGVPGTADYLADICEEIARNYDIDGISLDYIRYPEAGIKFSDAKTFKKYGNGLSLKQWRTRNVDRCVEAIHHRVKALKPWLKLSCSPVGKYADLPLHSSRGWNARDAVNQDVIKWMDKGWMDLIFPMMYFTGEHFYPFVPDWKKKAGDKVVAPGLGIYFLSPNEKNWNLRTISDELNYVRMCQTGGVALYREKFLRDNHKGLYDYLRNDHFLKTALPPGISHDGAKPEKPQALRADDGGKAQLTWDAVKDAHHYNVYLLEDSVFDDHSVRLLATNVKETAYTFAPLLAKMLQKSLAVTAVDAYGCESEACILAPTTNACCNTPHVGNVLDIPPFAATSLQILDLTGRIVLQKPYCKRLDISELPTGFYTLRSIGKKQASHTLQFFYHVAEHPENSSVH